jgi:type I restriction enzyme, S subunit
MSELPNSWAMISLGESCSLITDGTHHSPENGPDGEFKYVTAKNIKKGGLDLENITYVDADTHATIYRRCPTKKGDILYIKDGATTGAAVVNPLDEPFSLLSSVALIRPEQSVLLENYLCHLLNSPDMFQQMTGDMTGSAIRRLTLSTITRQMIPLAPLAEQGRIAAKIDSLSARHRRARDHLDHIPRLVERYKQAILAAAFRGALTRKWREAHSVGLNNSVGIRERVQAERDAMRTKVGLRAKGRNRSFPATVFDLPKLPLGWSWLTFDDCSWDLTVGHVGPMKDRYVKHGIPFLRSLNVRANHIDLSKVVYIDERFHRELAKSRLMPGDLIVVRTGEPGVAAVVPPHLKKANCSDLVISRLVQSMNPSYAAFYMNSEFAKIAVSNFQVGVAQQHFNVGAMSEMPIPFTSFAEQNDVVRCIESAFNWIDRLATETTSARKLIDHLDQAVLAKAFRGELVPQDPNDEPASVLLERIRASRQVTPARSGGRGRARASM